MATAVPSTSEFTGAGVTEGDFKAAMSALRDYLSGLLGTDGEITTALQTLGATMNGLLSKSGAYAVVAADKGKLINCTGTWTLSLLAAATAGDGFTIAVRNSATGVITVDGNSTETVDGGATLSVNAGESLILMCTGTLWLSVGKSSGVPSGAGMDWFSSTLPAGWLWQDGSAVSRTTYASLFAEIGTTFGVGDGSSTFNLPDCRGRGTVGKDDMGGTAASRVTYAASGIQGATLGASGGAQTHTLTPAQMPSHEHSLTDGAGYPLENYVTYSGPPQSLHPFGVVDPSNGVGLTRTAYAETGTAGSGQAHNNMQPTLICNKIIKT